MPILSHLPAFHSLSSHKLFSSPLPSIHHHTLPRICSPHKNPIICASITRKPRASRRVKSNEDLCDDIKEFLSIVGLPHDHVPSMKELSQHGRQDLANIVRRRGYKFIRELLATSAETRGTEAHMTRQQDIIGDDVGMSTGQHEKMKEQSHDTSLSSEDAEVKEHEKGLAEDASVSSSATKVEMEAIEFVEDVSFSLGAAGANLLEDNHISTETIKKPDSDEHICRDPESSNYLSLQGKVAKFIQDGELDGIEDNKFDVLNGETSEDLKEITESHKGIESKSASSPGVQNDLVLYGAEKLNGNSASPSHQVEHTLQEIRSSRTESHFTEEETMVYRKEDLEIEAQNLENQTQINRLKFLLHQKELELTQLKEQIEKEKVALSVLQTKADKEINKAQKLILEKDAELQAAEESLSGLKEVEIQYWGEGEVVEVAGSFNGWQQRVELDSQPSASISDPIGSQKSRLWRTVLWLYPGVYEIKFIVDGHWTVDSQRESVTRGTIHNNILRVVR